jgi:hypothetical protein
MSLIVSPKPIKIATYNAGYRLVDATAGTMALSKTSTANTDFQGATIYHTAGSTKIVTIRRVIVNLLSSSIAGDMAWEFRRLSAATAPATGNPAITPLAHDPADAAAEAACLALPTTAGSEAAADSPIGAASQMTLGAAVTGETTVPLRGGGPTRLILWDSLVGLTDLKDPIMRPGVAEGYAVIGRAVGVNDVIKFTVGIVFTEEAP